MIMGHESCENTKFNLKKIETKWSGLYKDIENFVDNYITCKKSGNKIVNTKNKNLNITQPNELWKVELVGYLSKNKAGNRFILVAIDHYSK